MLAAGRLLVVVGAILAALLPSPARVLAQTTQTSDNTAWWARVNGVDAATGCSAEAAWVHAIQVENQAEVERSTVGLPDVLMGPELRRAELDVASLKEQQAQPVDRIGWLSGHITGGSSDEVVVYANVIRRMGEIDPATADFGEQQWVDDDQAAYRLVRQDGTWRIVDRHVFEQIHRPLDATLMHDVTLIYRDLWVQLIDLYAARDGDGLAAVLDGQALVDYRARVQALADNGTTEQLLNQGRVRVLDVHDQSALGYLEGTVVPADGGQTSGQGQDSRASPTLTLFHRLQLDNGQWKIVDESGTNAYISADGTVHVDSCGSNAE